MRLPGCRRFSNLAKHTVGRFSGIIFALVLALTLLRAEPYTPTSDDEVLERLPAGFRRADARGDQEGLANDPENLRESVTLANSYLETARAEGDGRYHGFAQAVLSPWWDRDPMPPEVLFLRGRIHVGQWAFDSATSDLDRLLAQQTNHVGAQRLRFDVAVARGEFDLAERLLTRAMPSARGGTGDTWSLARARLLRLRGDALSADALVASWLASTPTLPVEDRHAALGILADLALQTGRTNLARQRFEAQRALGHRDVAATVAYADFLLEQGDPASVIPMADGESTSLAVALRLVVALDGVSRDDASKERRERRTALADQVRQQLEAQERRGDPSGLPDLVYHRLRIEKSAGDAAVQARDLWALRRELSDARWVLSAAVEARERTLGKAVADWVRTNHISDVRLKPWLERVEAWR